MMLSRYLRSALITLLLAALAATTPVPVSGQAGTKNGEWRHYGGDTGSTRYAPLDQINAGNFGKLEVAWRFKTDALGPRREFNLQSTPLMVNGRLYSTGGTRRAVVSLDAETGEMLWMHSENEGARAAGAPRLLSGRGLAYWTDGKEERILYLTPGYRLIALDAKTGDLVRGFGRNGVVDLKENFDQEIDLEKAPVGLHATPMIARNVVIVGAAFETGANPRSKENVKGYVRGFDVRTGRRLWIFKTIPGVGEFGNETWKEGSSKYTGNTGVWAQISVDEELGLAYLPVEMPTHDYFGGDRPGENLFSESLVAVELETGKRRWHFQLVHHGLWDMDIPCAPILADITINGRTIKAVAQPTKQSYLYVFNRETGQPIWPIVERPVPIGDTPGEWYSPTQPIPTKPLPYDGIGLTTDDLIDYTPELRAEAVKLVSRYRLGPAFTPPSVSRMEGPIATLTMGAQGASVNWPGGSYDPETHTLYVASQTTVASLGLVPPPPGVSDMAFHQGTVLTGARTAGGSGSSAAGNVPTGVEAAGPILTVRGLPLTKPPYSRITAINMDTGDFRWQVPFGATPDNIRNNPALKGVTLPPVTGRVGNNPGTLVTKTLLIVGEKNFGPTPSGERGAMLRALDKMTGKEVAAIEMPAPQTGSPMTYMLRGRQYLVIAISGGNYSGELVAYRLPEGELKAAAAPAQASSSPSRAVLAPTGTLRASFIANNPVQGRVDEKTKETTGPGPDLVRELARRLGVPHEIRPLPNAGAVLESVRTGAVDIGFLAREAERATQVDFSDAYISSGAAYLVRANAPYQKSADVDRAGVTIGAISGQSPEVYVRGLVKQAKVESLPSVPPNAAIGKMLLDGKVQAFAANRTRMEEVRSEVPGLRVLADDYMETLQAIVVPKGNTARLAEVNRFVADAVRSGFVKASIEKSRLVGVSVAPEKGTR